MNDPSPAARAGKAPRTKLVARAPAERTGLNPPPHHGIPLTALGLGLAGTIRLSGGSATSRPDLHSAKQATL